MKSGICYSLLFIVAAVNGADTLRVDVGQVLANTSRHPIGINLNYLRDNDDNFSAGRPIQEALKEMGVKYLRYPGGEKSDYYLWSLPPYAHSNPQVFDRGGKSPEPYKTKWAVGHKLLDFDQFMTLAEAIGARPLIVVGATPQEGFTNGPVSRATYLENAVTWVRYANITKKYGVKYWEIGNEDWGDYTADQTAALVIEFSRAMKQVDPTIQIGISGNSEAYFTRLLELAGGDIDFFTASNYPVTGWKANFYQQTARVDLLKCAEFGVAAVNHYRHGKYKSKIKTVATEINTTDWMGGELGWANDLLHAMINFEIFGQVVTQPQMDFGLFWTTRWMDPGSDRVVNALNQTNGFTASGRVVAIWGQFLRDEMVGITRSDELVPFATLGLADHELNVLILNKDDFGRSTVIPILAATKYAAADVYVFAGTGLHDLHPTWGRQASLRILNNTARLTLPADSITVISLHPARLP